MKVSAMILGACAIGSTALATDQQGDRQLDCNHDSRQFWTEDQQEYCCGIGEGLTGCETRLELLSEYPGLLIPDNHPDTVTRHQTQRGDTIRTIMCPFLRMFFKAGFWDDDIDKDVAFRKALDQLREEQGLPVPEYTGIQVPMSAVQRLLHYQGLSASSIPVTGAVVLPHVDVTHESDWVNVNLEALWNAPGGSHDCGMAFDLNAHEVEDDYIAKRLQQLDDISGNDGMVTYEDLHHWKVAVCTDHGVDTVFKDDHFDHPIGMSPGHLINGHFEMGFIFSICGGLERGFVDLFDVERFLKAELPKSYRKPTLWFGNLEATRNQILQFGAQGKKDLERVLSKVHKSYEALTGVTPFAPPFGKLELAVPGVNPLSDLFIYVASVYGDALDLDVGSSAAKVGRRSSEQVDGDDEASSNSALSVTAIGVTSLALTAFAAVGPLN